MRKQNLVILLSAAGVLTLALGILAVVITWKVVAGVSQTVSELGDWAHDPTPGRFQDVTVGMTKEQVIATVGRPPNDEHSLPDGVTQYDWPVYEGTRHLILYLRDGRVIGKSEEGTVPTSMPATTSPSAGPG